MDPAFQYKKMRTLVPLFARCTRKLISKWQKQMVDLVKVEEGLTELTLDAIGMAFLWVMNGLSSAYFLFRAGCFWLRFWSC